MSKGFFITFEGGEGVGKSTQVTRLASTLRASGMDVIQTREPGGAKGAEAIRELLVNGEPGRWNPLSEALLFAAARDDHLNSIIRPALADGKVIICDRFSDSTKAYQGAAGGICPNLIDTLNKWVVGDEKPDLTLILDLDPRTGLERARVRGGTADRFESNGIEFHQAIRRAFVVIANEEPDRCVVIDADRPEDTIFDNIEYIVRERLVQHERSSRIYDG